MLIPALLCACSMQMKHQDYAGVDMAMDGPRVPGGCEAPAAANHGRMGCYLDAAVEIGPLPGQAYWHVDEFPNEASARGAATGGSAIVTAYGRTFLETVNADAAWRPAEAVAWRR